MSADNRILIHQCKHNSLWYVWEASCSINYFQPPETAKVFDVEELALAYAFTLEDKCAVLEGGIQRLTESEIVTGLKEELVSLIKENLELKELVDSAYNVVELFDTKDSEYNTKDWKPLWLENAKKYRVESDF